MSSSVIGALRVNLGLDSARFSKGMTDAQRSLHRLRSQFRLAAAGASLVGGALLAMARNAMTTIDAQAKLARAVGGTTAGLQALARAGDRAGVQQSEMAAAVTRLNQRLGQAIVQGKGAEGVFARLGITAQELSDMDIDRRFAAISDAMRDAGMSTQEMSFYLRELGIRQASVITLIQSGSDEITRSRDAINAFGVAVSDVDAAAIERANDALSEVGRVFEGIRNQLAVSLAPTIERVANAFTNAARAGQPLGDAIRFMIANVQRLTTYVATFVTIMGVRYVRALVMARAATLGLSGSLMVLRGAMIATGVGALVVAAGELILLFTRLIERTGGFRNALITMKNVAVEVFDRIVIAFNMVPTAIAAGSARMRAFFLEALESMLQGFQDLTWAVAEGLNKLFGTNLQGARISAIQNEGAEWGNSPLGDAITASRNEAREAEDRLSNLATAAARPLKSLRALRDESDKVKDGLGGAADAADDLGDELDDLGGGRGGSAGAAADALEEAKTEAEGFAEALEQAAKSAEDLGAAKANILIGGIDGVSSAFGDFVANGLQDFKGFTRSIVDSFKGMLAQMIALAARNRIMVGLGLQAPGGGPGAGLATGLASSAGGLSGVAGSFLSGAGSWLSGGVSGGMSAIAGAGAGLGGLAGAVGAIAGPIGIAVGLLSLFRRRKQQSNETSKAVDEDEAKRMDEALQLRLQLAEATGDANFIWRNYLGTLDEANRGLARQVRDAQRASEIGRERTRLEEELLRVQGQFAELQRRQIMELPPALRAIQREINLTVRQNDLNDQRARIEEELLRAQGNVAELRRRELDALPPTLRSMKQMVFALQDTQEAARQVSQAFRPEQFATMFEFQRAVGRSMSGLSNTMRPANVPRPPNVSTISSTGGAGTSAEVIELRAIVRELRQFKAQSQRLDAAQLSEQQITAATLRGFARNGIRTEAI